MGFQSSFRAKSPGTFTFGSEFKRQPGQLSTRPQGPCQGTAMVPMVPLPSARAWKESRAKAVVNMAPRMDGSVF